MDTPGGQATHSHLRRVLDRLPRSFGSRRRLRGGLLSLTLLLVVSFLVILFDAPDRSACDAMEPAGLVARVIDGDTVELASGAMVRYIGVDAPEVRVREHGQWRYAPEPMAEAASALNRELVEGRQVRLEYDRELCDRYGRRLAYLFIDDRFVNGELVERGAAVVKIYPPNDRYRRELQAAQRAAQAKRAGIWERSGP